jgi:hypothetical protein
MRQRSVNPPLNSTRVCAGLGVPKDAPFQLPIHDVKLMLRPAFRLSVISNIPPRRGGWIKTMNRDEKSRKSPMETIYCHCLSTVQIWVRYPIPFATYLSPLR